MSISVLNTDAGLSGKTIVNAEDSQTVTGQKTFDRDPNAPFVVTAGSAVVTNLDADKVDGYEATELGVLAEAETVAEPWTFNKGVKFAAAGVLATGPMVGGNSNTLRLVGGTGGVDVVNNAVSTQLLSVSDAGIVTVPIGPLNVAGGVANTGYSTYATATPTQLTGNVNDWNPTGLITKGRLRISSDASRTVTGIVAAVGVRVLLINVGTQNIVFSHNSGSSSANNRIYCPGASDFTLNLNDSVFIDYDDTDLKWRILAF